MRYLLTFLCALGVSGVTYTAFRATRVASATEPVAAVSAGDSCELCDTGAVSLANTVPVSAPTAKTAPATQAKAVDVKNTKCAVMPDDDVTHPEEARQIRARTATPRGGIFERVEAFISKLSMRDNFWNAVCSFIWLPLAFFSGLRMKEVDASTYVARAVLPFRRFNRNWYRAMAGGALLANSEIAGGSYVFGIVGADYTVVCKHLEYKFLRPCLGPAVYRMTPREDIKQHLTRGGEFNITLDLDISQQGFKGERDRRVGRCEVTFHVTPKVHHKRKAQRKRG